MAQNTCKNKHLRDEYCDEDGNGIPDSQEGDGGDTGDGAPDGGTAEDEVVTIGSNGEQLFYYHSDHLGSTGYVTRENGELHEHIQYFPFGETWVQQGGNTEKSPYLFTSKELDEETGLYYFGARYYDPRTSVWVSADPIISAYLNGERGMGGVYNSQNLGLYSYAHLNPVKFTDPDGRAAAAVVVVGGGVLVVGGIITANDPQAREAMERVVEQGIASVKESIETAILVGSVFNQLVKNLVFNESSDSDAADDAGDAGNSEAPPLPDVLVGDQSDTRAGPNKRGNRHTSGPLLPEHGGTGDFEEDLKTLGGEVRPWQPGDSAPPGSLVGENGVFGRPDNSSGGASIDIPASGGRPHETLHY